jgi:lysophospholipase L1-like esterase
MDKLMIANPEQEDEPTAGKLVTYESMGVDAATLSDLIAQDYFGGYKIVSALAQEYGFKYFFFVPPTITQGNKPLTPEEQEMKRKEESQTGHHKLSTSVYDIVERESSKYQHLYSMVHVFDPYDSLMWIDGGHATPVGNQVIAEKMLAVIQAQSSDRK